MTSRRPDTTRIYNFNFYWRDWHNSGNFSTLPQYFKENGYHTQSVSKVYHAGTLSGGQGVADYPYSWSEPNYDPPAFGSSFMDFECYEYGGSPQLSWCPTNTDIHGKLADQQSSDFAIEYLRNRSNIDEPFFLGLGYHKPHVPFKVPQEFLDIYQGNYEQDVAAALAEAERMKILNQRAEESNDDVDPAEAQCPSNCTFPSPAWVPLNQLRQTDDIRLMNIPFPWGTLGPDYTELLSSMYDVAVTYMDYELGRVLSELDRLGLASNTIIVFLGDHGMKVGELDMWEKATLFDIDQRIPLLVYKPGTTFPILENFEYFPFQDPFEINARRKESTDKQAAYNVQAGQQTDGIIEAIDIFPSMVDLAGLPPLDDCPESARESRETALCTEGRSFAPLVRDATRQVWKDASFSQYPRPGLQPDQNTVLVPLDSINLMGYSIRTADYLYNEWIGYDSEFFLADWDDVQARELYDLASDPDNEFNVVDDEEYADVVEVLATQIRLGWRNALPTQ